MSSRVLGVLDGRDMSVHALSEWVESAEIVIAADGAANRLFEAGLKPDRIVGDFDVVSREARDSGTLLVRDPDQSRTDCDKLLSLVKAGGHSQVTLVSVEGDLPDHELATLHSAVASGIDVRFAYRRGMGWIVRSSASCRARVSVGARISLLPISPCLGVTMGGVHWAVSGRTMEPGGFSSVANIATQRDVTAELLEGSALLFVEYVPEEMPFW